MKKYFVSFSAIVIAAIAFAFTAPKANLETLYVFEFQQANFDELVVEDEDKWTFITSSETPTLCADIDEKACKVAVPVTLTFVNGSGVRKLSSSASVQAAELNNIGYVTSISGASSIYSNKAQ